MIMTKRHDGYPKDFPQDVPPLCASDAHGVGYRLVRENPPIPNDFVGFYKEKGGPKPGMKPNFYGTSLFRSQTGIERMRMAYPRPHKNKKIAYGELESNFGKVSNERPTDGHFELWLKVDTGIEKKFRVIE